MGENITKIKVGNDVRCISLDNSVLGDGLTGIDNVIDVSEEIKFLPNRVLGLEASIDLTIDNVFIMYHERIQNKPVMSRIHKWPELQSKGELADGVMLVEVGKMLVIAPTESGYLRWSQDGSNIVEGGGTTATDYSTAFADFDGKKSTSSQITHEECNSIDCAPGFCAAYSRTNSNGVGLTAGKWWLPSMGELMMISANRTKVNYALSLIDGAEQMGSTYWSSTEKDGRNAWHLPFSNSNAIYGLKAKDTVRVRPVSEFII